MTQTYTDTNVNQLTINKLNKTEYNNLPQVSDTELYLVEEQIDDTPTENSTNPVSSGGVYEALQSCTQTAPLGAILPFAGSTIPENWLLCDGSAISRTTYAELFAHIGTRFGSGDGSTTFNIPDLRETVPVGAGTSTRADISDHDSYDVGEFKDDQFQQHTHQVYTSDYNTTTVQGDYVPTTSYASAKQDKYWDALIGRTGTTTHGKQLGVNYIIRVLGGSSEIPEQPINYNNIPIVFTQASSADNVASGDTLAEMFGKLQKQYNTPSRKYNGNYVTNGDKLVLTMSANDIPYGTSATFIISGWGNTASLDILVVKRGDTWYSNLTRLDSNWQSIDVNSTTVADDVVTVKLDVTTSSSNKFTFNPVSGVRFNVSVE